MRQGIVLLQTNMVSEVLKVGFELLMQPGGAAGHCYKWYFLGR